MTDIPEITDEQFERAIPARLRRRLVQGRFESGEDIAALRTFVGPTQAESLRGTPGSFERIWRARLDALAHCSQDASLGGALRLESVSEIRCSCG